MSMLIYNVYFSCIRSFESVSVFLFLLQNNKSRNYFVSDVRTRSVFSDGVSVLSGISEQLHGFP